MAAKVILIACAFALLVQAAQSALVPGFGPFGLAGPYGLAGSGCGYNGLASAYDGFAPALAYEGFGYGCSGVASTGGGLPCASASPIPPVGVSVLSENVYEGPLAVGGNLPFLGTVAVEGVLPTAGAAAVSYGCGSSRCAIGAEEGAIATGIAPHAPTPYGPYGGYGIAPAAYNGFAGFGYGAGCGCGGIY